MLAAGAATAPKQSSRDAPGSTDGGGSGLRAVRPDAVPAHVPELLEQPGEEGKGR